MSFKKAAMQQAMKLMASPSVGKLMQNPKFMQAMMTAMSLPGKVQAHLDDQRRNIARVFHLATREEVEGLKSTIRDLDSKIVTLRQENETLKTKTRTGGNGT